MEENPPEEKVEKLRDIVRKLKEVKEWRKKAYPEDHNGATKLTEGEAYEALTNSIPSDIPDQESNIIVELKKERPLPEIKISTSKDVADLVANMQDYDREFFKVIYLTTKNMVLGIETISKGSLSANVVHQREVFKGAVLANASAIITVHNHPSGIVAPSEDDLEITKRLNEAAKLMSIGYLDHVIIGRGAFVSLKERNPELFSGGA